MPYRKNGYYLTYDKCGRCDKPSHKTCSCTARVYCSQKCQRSEWKLHKNSRLHKNGIKFHKYYKKALEIRKMEIPAPPGDMEMDYVIYMMRLFDLITFQYGDLVRLETTFIKFEFQILKKVIDARGMIRTLNERKYKLENPDGVD